MNVTVNNQGELMKSIKHLIILFAIILGSNGVIPNAHAAYGVFTTLTGGIGAGIGAFFLGGFIAIPSTVMMFAENESRSNIKANLWATATILGLIILDKNTGSIQFQEISMKNAFAVGLSTNEMHAYNDELNRINGLISEGISALANAPENERELLRSNCLEEMRSELSLEAFTALQKIIQSANK